VFARGLVPCIRRAHQFREIDDLRGITTAAVSGWERDQAIPEFGHLRKLPKILKTSANWLFCGDDPAENEIDALWSRMDAGQRRQALRILKGLMEDSQDVSP